MKKILLYSLWSLMAVLQAFSSLAKKAGVEKTKQIEKSYTVGSSTLLSIENSFGQVHINEWDKKEFFVRVIIKVNKNNEERAKGLLSKINVEIKDRGDVRSFKTDIDGSVNNKNSEEFSIDYEVYMPSGNPLKVINAFGDTYVASRQGDNELDFSYGHFKLERLTGDIDLKISFSDGSAEAIGDGKVVVKYSDTHFGEVGDVVFEQGFSEVKIKKARRLDMLSKYGDVRITETDVIQGKVSFSDLSIERLNQSITLETSYSDGLSIKKVSKNVELIDLKGKFGSFYLSLEEGVNASVEVRTSFCDLRYDKNEIDMSKMNGVTTKHSGTIGSGSPAKIKIESSYGDVRLDVVAN